MPTQLGFEFKKNIDPEKEMTTICRFFLVLSFLASCCSINQTTTIPSYQWGKFSTEGLQLGIRVHKKNYQKSEKLKIDVAIRNVSEQTVETPIVGKTSWEFMSILAKDSQGKEYEGINVGAILSHKKKKKIMLAPKKTVYKTFDLAEVWSEHGTLGSGMAYLLDMPIGEYTLVARYDPNIFELAKSEAETNYLLSGETTFEID